ncbi:MAG: TlpA disulfide reductase family protein [Deltaproteobacteria bacterium]|nr:TlpA disulfide reductase family protein [Deltaproteobacteria bacterium]
MLSLALTFFVTTAAPPVVTPTTPPPKPAAAAAPTTTTMAPVSDKDYAATILAPRAGRIVVVNFWASYCLPCIEEIPALQELGKQYAGKVDVVFVSSDPPSQAPHALAVLKRRKVELVSFIVSNEDPDPFIHMIDKEWQGEMPFTVVYNGKGEAIQKLPGAHTRAEFQAAIDAALAATTKKP